MTDPIQPAGKGKPIVPPTKQELNSLQKLSQGITNAALSSLENASEKPRSPDPKITRSPQDPTTDKVSKEFFENKKNFTVLKNK